MRLLWRNWKTGVLGDRADREDRLDLGIRDVGLLVERVEHVVPQARVEWIDVECDPEVRIERLLDQ